MDAKYTDLQFPDSLISKIIKSHLGSNTRISKDAIKLISRCSLLFAIYLATISSSIKDKKRQLIQDSQIEEILRTLDFKKNSNNCSQTED
ncbi:hypothetical protein FG379_002949 [Cryptosporidium bovis]|uniref:uncharacterized protein n=1 Tax=Cryptosporidium bovis TaxID=310047 RepID=UPI00351A30C2|nr:hypothetical protein FG379_002949 [Cryptosporidium bovis]